MMTSSNLFFRRAVQSDAAALAEFGARTFQETFGAANSPQDMLAYLESNYGISQQWTELQDANIITIIAEKESRLVAYAQVRRQSSPVKVPHGNSVELWRFYVDSPWHGHGVAQSLIEHVHVAADELGGQTIWLSVWERNERAIAFYKKCGFSVAGTKKFWLGSDQQSDYVMTVEVNKPSSFNSP